MGYAIAFDSIHHRLLSPKGPAASSFISRGPFLGHQKGDCWIAGEPQSRFAVGEIVAWQLHATMQPTPTLIVRTELWCEGHPVQMEETRMAAEQSAAGWTSFGIQVPKDVTGDCHLERHVQTQDENGSLAQDYDLRGPIALVIAR